MKKLLFLLFLIGQFFIASAQTYHVDLQVASLAESTLAPFIFSNDLTGAPRIFAVSISPEQGTVRVRFELYWKQDLNSGYEWLLTFRTKLFQARSFFNTDLGSSILVGRNSSNGDLIEENRKRNKLTGAYRLDVYLMDENGNQLATDSESFEFSNPAQTLSVLSPLQGSIENIGGVLAEWTQLDGVEYYQILANVKDESTQSLEDALETGTPLINNVQVGVVTSVDLRTILQREWLPGQEIAFQVSAMPIGGSPADLIRSEIVSFYLDDPSNPIDKQASDEMMNLLQSIPDGLGSDLLNKLISGEIGISDINWEDTGLPMTPEEIQDFLNYMKEHPSNLISIEQD